jgi:hypothetical protein
VNWVYDNPRGGYGFTHQVAGVVVTLTAKRAIIKIARKVAGEWTQEQRSVPPGNLTARVGRRAELGKLQMKDALSQKAIGVEVDGSVEWHVPGVAGADYATLCGLDGNDPAVGQTGTVGAPRGTKINCRECRTIWQRLRQLKLRDSDFVAA